MSAFVKSICVYCASASSLAEEYHVAARQMGDLIGRRGHTLVWGGSNCGTMATLAESARKSGARLVGVIPKAFADRGIACPDADEMHVTADLRERKALMDRKADAFVALAGGIGTLEELIEILVLKQINFHRRAVVLVNTLGFYDPFLAFLDKMVADRFMRAETRDYLDVVETPEQAIDLIESYAPPEITSKWSAG
jgi:uncharacterized protein (TIGR00730 family)